MFSVRLTIQVVKTQRGRDKAIIFNPRFIHHSAPNGYACMLSGWRFIFAAKSTSLYTNTHIDVYVCCVSAARTYFLFSFPRLTVYSVCFEIHYPSEHGQQIIPLTLRNNNKITSVTRLTPLNNSGTQRSAINQSLWLEFVYARAKSNCASHAMMNFLIKLINSFLCGKNKHATSKCT